ncbi:hypothetical protein [Novosphingobium sp. PY1]|uniref:Transcriptional regulator, TetR family n=1 Tax=Ochrobactrum sp. PW1 TaxID=1882222 RepID=A0A292GMV2_9HYPH|nr:hypothetical protein [Novosphingobium sp. PY1]BBA74443.1 Transcriptional regulator, TetR family [Ochrobactrum sp. PW1]GFM29292.1 transcriptional regulator, TetR family [Novosphingobium sp. PY1]
MEPSKAAMERANELIREITPENVLTCHKVDPQNDYVDDAFCRYIDTVDRVAREAFEEADAFVRPLLKRLTLPDEPDPLAEALELTQVHFSSEDNAAALRAALTAAGYEIVKKDDGR